MMKNPRLIKIKNVKFDTRVTKNNKAQLIPNQAKEIFASKNWVFDQYNFDNNMLKAFEYILQAECQRVKIVQIKDAQLFIKAISQPKFTLLVKLEIKKNNIVSIESLIFINADHLKDFNVSANQSTCLKPLNKINWKQLKNLDSIRNHVIRMDFGRIKMPKLFDSLRTESICHPCIINEDASYLSKVDLSRSSSQTNLINENRMTQRSVYLSLKNKIKVYHIKEYGGSNSLLVNFLLADQGAYINS